MTRARQSLRRASDRPVRPVAGGPPVLEKMTLEGQFNSETMPHGLREQIGLSAHRPRSARTTRFLRDADLKDRR